MWRTVQLGVIAGIAGACAEVAWVALYAALSGSDAVEVAREVASAVSGGAVTSALAGFAVHMLLGAALGLALALAWRSLAPRLVVPGLFGFALVVLAALWKVNFFVVLPAISPSFVHLLPYAVSLSSKLLFAAAAAAVLGSTRRKDGYV